MMKLRKWSDLNKAEKLGRKKSLKEAFIAFCVLTLFTLGAPFASLLVSAILSGQNLTDFILIGTGDLILLLFIVLAIIFCLSIYIYFLIKKQNISYAYDKLKKD